MSTPLSKADQLENRLISFAVQIVVLSSRLPRTQPGRHISAQILRSGTSAAANYAEARGAESRADFIHKLRIVFKELNETTVWLRILTESSLMSADLTIAIIAENQEPLPNRRGVTQNRSREHLKMSNVQCPISMTN